MGHAARLEDVQAATALAAALDVAQQNPGVHQRGNGALRGLKRAASAGQIGEQGRDLVHLQEVNDPQQHGANLLLRGHHAEIGDGVYHHDLGFELLDQVVHGHQVHFQAVHGATRRLEPQQAALHPGLQVQADGAHVAHDLARRLLEGVVETALPPPAGAVGEVSGHAGLARAGGAGDQDAGAPIVSLSAHHGVQAWDAAGDALRGDRVVQPQRGDGQHGDPFVPDQEGVFIAAVA